MFVLVVLVALFSTSLAVPFGNNSITNRDWQKTRNEILDIIQAQSERIRQLEAELLALETEGHAIHSTSGQVKVPSTCGDVWKLGHEKAGFYPVVLNDQLQFVYCDMSDYTAFVVGNVDTKESVHFYTHRSGDYKNNNNPVIISYSTRLLAHPAMDDAIGRFTAPKSGTYFFHFHCYTHTAGVFGENTADRTKVALLVNSAEVAFNYAYTDYFTENTMAITVTLELMEGDHVETRFEYGNIRNPYFGGYLIQADTTL